MKITNVGNLAHLLSSFSSPGFGKMKIDKYFFFNMKVSKVGILQGCIKLGVTVPLLLCLLLFLRATSKYKLLGFCISSSEGVGKFDSIWY